MEKFNNDLTHAQKAERLVSVFIATKGFKTILFNNDNKYDILTTKDGKSVTWEVKSDGKAHFTNNFYIEFESYNKPSGLMVTQSKYFVLLIPRRNIGYVLNTTQLRTFINSIKNDLRWVMGGDDNMTKGYLVDVDYLMENVEHKTMEFDMSIMYHNEEEEKEIAELERLLQAAIDERYANEEEDELPF